MRPSKRQRRTMALAHSGTTHRIETEIVISPRSRQRDSDIEALVRKALNATPLNQGHGCLVHGCSGM